MRNTLVILFLFTLSFSLSGCDLMAERLENVGRAPSLSQPVIYEEPKFDSKKAQIEAMAKLKYPGYESGHDNEHTRGELPKNSGNLARSSNSIWSSGSRSFFKNRRVGDILSVIISIQDQAQINNSTQKNRQSGSKMGIPGLFGLQKTITKALPGTSDNLVDLNSRSSSAGSGKINRKEVIDTIIATTIVKLLPSGNFVIRGSQEVRVNYEMREITIEGIVRPEDIASNNTVKLSQVAEARLSYGGKGHISEYQQEPYGKQIIDIISPF